MHVRSETELESTLKAFLAERPGDGELWIFGYGSLMWNPAIHFDTRAQARLQASVFSAMRAVGRLQCRR